MPAIVTETCIQRRSFSSLDPSTRRQRPRPTGKSATHGPLAAGKTRLVSEAAGLQLRNLL